MASKKSKGTKPLRTLTEEQKAILPELAGRLTRAQVAHYFGMSANTLVRICRDEPEVEALYNQGRANTTEDIVSVLIKKAKSGDFNSIKLYLERMGGWHETTVVKQETKEVKTFSDMYEDDDENEDDDE